MDSALGFCKSDLTIIFLWERGFFLSCFRAAKPAKKHMNLSKGKVLLGRVNLFLAVCLKLLGVNISELLLSVSCCFVWRFAWLPFCVFFSTCSNLTVFSSFSPLQALKLTRDVEREPFAKSAVSKWTVILFTAYDLCEPCIIFLMKQTVNRPLTGVKNLLFFLPLFLFFFLFLLEIELILQYAKSSFSGMAKHLRWKQCSAPSCWEHTV